MRVGTKTLVIIAFVAGSTAQAAGSSADHVSGHLTASEQAKWLYGQEVGVLEDAVFDEGGMSGYRVRMAGKVTDTVIIVDSGRNVVGTFRLQSVLPTAAQAASAVSFFPYSLEQNPGVRKLLKNAGMEIDTHDGILLVTSPIPDADLRAIGPFHVVVHVATEDARFVALLPDWRQGKAKTLVHPEDEALRVDTLSGEIILRHDGSMESAMVMFHRVRSEERLALQ